MSSDAVGGEVRGGTIFGDEIMRGRCTHTLVPGRLAVLSLLRDRLPLVEHAQSLPWLITDTETLHTYLQRQTFTDAYSMHSQIKFFLKDMNLGIHMVARLQFHLG